MSRVAAPCCRASLPPSLPHFDMRTVHQSTARYLTGPMCHLSTLPSLEIRRRHIVFPFEIRSVLCAATRHYSCAIPLPPPPPTPPDRLQGRCRAWRAQGSCSTVDLRIRFSFGVVPCRLLVEYMALGWGAAGREGGSRGDYCTKPCQHLGADQTLSANQH